MVVVLKNISVVGQRTQGRTRSLFRLARSDGVRQQRNNPLRGSARPVQRTHVLWFCSIYRTSQKQGRSSGGRETAYRRTSEADQGSDTVFSRLLQWIIRRGWDKHSPFPLSKVVTGKHGRKDGLYEPGVCPRWRCLFAVLDTGRQLTHWSWRRFRCFGARVDKHVAKANVARKHGAPISAAKGEGGGRLVNTNTRGFGECCVSRTCSGSSATITGNKKERGAVRKPCHDKRMPQQGSTTKGEKALPSTDLE